MRKIFVAAAIVVGFSSAQVQAGFEWIPPAEQPVMQETAPTISSPASEMSNAMPAAPVTAEPLAAPRSVFPAPQRVRSKTMGNLYINPYPLRDNSSMGGVESSAVIDQAMMEKSRTLNPVQLGSGMTTGVKPQKKAPVHTMVLKAKTVASINTDSLTPMMGGEPAPLPGYTRDGVKREPLRQYTQAVGFGKDLPLALALSQVIPGDFTHRFEGDVDPSVSVSWEGGKPWNLVLADMLADQNLTANIEGNVVIIKAVSTV